MVNIAPSIRSQFGYSYGGGQSQCLESAYRWLKEGRDSQVGIYQQDGSGPFYAVTDNDGEDDLTQALQRKQPGLIVMERKFDFKA